MATPPVQPSDVYAYVDGNGQPFYPPKEQIILFLDWVVAMLNGNIVVKTTQALLNADLAHADGTPGIVYADATLTLRGPYVKVGASGTGSWAQLPATDTVSQNLIIVINNIMRRVVVLATDITVDRVNLLNGGANQCYAPQGVFIDIPGAAASNITILPPASELTGTVKLAIPAGVRGFLYVDLTDNTYHMIAATGGDFTLPGLTIDKIVPIATFSANGNISSPYRVRDLNPSTQGTGFMPIIPIVHSAADNKVLIPSGTYRSTLLGIVTHTVTAPATYEEFAGSTSTTALITYWFDAVSNTYNATAVGVEPFNIHPTRGIILGYSYNNQFWSPWPHVGFTTGGHGRNTFDKSKFPSQAPKVQIAPNAHIVAITESNLLALGFTEGMSNNHGTSPLPAYGDFMPDTRSPGRFFARVWIQTNAADDFGVPRVWFVKDPAFSSASNSVGLTLEKKLSSNAAIYSGSIAIPDPALATNPAGPWSFYYVGTGAASPSGTADRYAVTGVQFDDVTPDVRWIPRTDFPDQPNIFKRVSALEAGSAVTDPAITDIAYGPDMYLTAGVTGYLWTTCITPIRVDIEKYITSFVSLKHTAVDTDGVGGTDMVMVDAYIEEGINHLIKIDPSKVGDVTYLSMRRFADTVATPMQRYTRRGITVHVAPALITPTVTKLFHQTGDSLNSPVTVKQQYKAKAASRGVRTNFIGSREYLTPKFVGNEARGGWSWASMVNAITLPGQVGQPVGLTKPLPVGQEALYLTMGDDTDNGIGNKIEWNPYIRVSTGGDDPAKVFFGYIYDFAFYLNRWTGTTLGALPVPEYVSIDMGTGDINLFTDPVTGQMITKGMDIVIPSMLAAGVAHISIVLPTFPYSDRNAVWPEQFTAFRTIMGWVDTFADARVKVVSAWAHMDPNVGWPNNYPGQNPPGSGLPDATVDPVTGFAVETVADHIHYYDDLNRTTINEAKVAWLIATIAGV